MSAEAARVKDIQAAPVPEVHRVVICDAQELSRAGLRTMLQGDQGLLIEAEAEGSRELDILVRRLRPDVVVLGLDTYARDDLAALRSIAELVPLVMLSGNWNEQYALYALRAGVRGLVHKGDRRQVLIDAVRTVTDGEMFLAPPLTEQLVTRMVRRAPATRRMHDSIAALTEREHSVLRSLALGMSTEEIAVALFISSATVKSHISHMLNKLGLRDRVQAVVLAHRMGLVDD
ncbi:LuxR C-terminal-related transcriptional regulator [Amycolatopsis pithecellobii]|uniref:Response regulator n=1 Tax=Amycolatopsis pithecellobii TaxID=664692 RepID=A0A6N7YVQ1_9PSEU|nr:response regulator transcription factor [Amycolatopsis pithecellobii]MTD52399.1 response regulator [Amycolatopsis pithecellobii]